MTTNTRPGVCTLHQNTFSTQNPVCLERLCPINVGHLLVRSDHLTSLQYVFPERKGMFRLPNCKWHIAVA